MIPLPTQSQEPRQDGVREHERETQEQPRPWTAPDFVERSVCAEIGAYSFHER
jgi:hypothetical protein